MNDSVLNHKHVDSRDRENGEATPEVSPRVKKERLECIK
jgi:hypothetical protein